jgi:hypothetical protein
MQAIIKVVPVEPGPPHPRLWHALECRICAYPWVLTVATGFRSEMNDAAQRHFNHPAHMLSEARMLDREKMRVYNCVPADAGEPAIYEVWCGRCRSAVAHWTDHAQAMLSAYTHAGLSHVGG